MNKKMSKRQKDLKSKLMAAICMLLVSSIMMVSTTYAWFTLSTAPEVTGITTAVGANGNLEMALLPSYAMDAERGTLAHDFGITTNVGDSVNKAIRNNTWGNLVELSGEGYNYGMDKMVLYPAALNAVMDDSNLNPASVVTSGLLQTPTYGADGRVSELVANTVTSLYSTDNNGSFPQIPGYGVRAIGTAAGMTDRQLAYRNARSSASTAMVQATTNASGSLNRNGAILGSIAMKKATNGDAAEYTKAEVESLLAITTDLLGASGNTGVLQYIENAYKQYIIAYAASNAMKPVFTGEGEAQTHTGMTDQEFSAFASTINACADLTAVKAALGSVNISDVTTYMDSLIATKNKVAGVQSALTALLAGKDENAKFSWNDISTPLANLADMNAMKINSYTIDNVKENLGSLVGDVTSGKGVTVTMATGGGVYADIADHCGDYTAGIKLQNVSYGDINVGTLDAKMATASTVNPYLSNVGTVVENAGAPTSAEGEGGQIVPITDLYGYIIDLAFRTNAAESSLLLATTPQDRIYTENTDTTADTMGKGSTMTFEATNAGFTQEQMIELMKAIRIVFMDPMSGSVYATAMVDASTAVKGGDGMTVTGNVYLYENKDSAVSYRTPTGEEVATHVENAVYKEADATNPGTHYKSGDEYVKITAENPAPEGTSELYYFEGYSYSKATDGQTATHVEVTTTKGPQLIKAKSEAVIAPLVQNQIKTVSALVYLDGELVGNDDVAATAATSMTGSLNLQFASSANLVPMNYTPLMNQTGSGETETYTVTLDDGATGAAKATKNTAYTFTLGTDKEVASITVGGTALTANDDYTVSGQSVTIKAEKVTGAIDIATQAVTQG